MCATVSRLSFRSGGTCFFCKSPFCCVCFPQSGICSWTTRVGLPRGFRHFRAVAKVYGLRGGVGGGWGGLGVGGGGGGGAG